MALRPSQHAPSRLSTVTASGVTQKSPRSGAFKEGALRGPGRPQSVHANTQRPGTVVPVPGIQKVHFGSKMYLLNPVSNQNSTFDWISIRISKVY